MDNAVSLNIFIIPDYPQLFPNYYFFLSSGISLLFIYRKRKYEKII